MWAQSEELARRAELAGAQRARDLAVELRSGGGLQRCSGARTLEGPKFGPRQNWMLFDEVLKQFPWNCKKAILAKV